MDANLDVKNLKIPELKTLCEKVREEILAVTEQNGGHLSSNLGIVETIVALYHVFDFPTDKLIFDVGHQCYAHKILSDRQNKFSTIRQDGGLSGFPDREESPFDCFGAGHAGTALASAIGLCTARDKKGEDFSVISVVGDGAMTNGLNLEAISVSNEKPKKFIVILNDNGMSISKNKNGFYRFITKRTTSKGYIGSKKAIKKVFGKTFITRWLGRFKNFIARILGKDDYFDNHGFKYVGVVNGNDVGEMVKILSRVKQASKEEAILLHVRTTKGKGHKKAEAQADLYHGVGKRFKAESGDFSLALGEVLNEQIEKDNSIMAITAAMKDGTGLFAVEKEHPKNFMDVGIAEEYAVVSAAGMAVGGLKPVVAIYSTFMQRAYDQVLHDVCLQNLPVVFCLDRAGLVGGDGKTHQGVFDLSYLLHLPNMTVLAPSTAEELKDAVRYALSLNSPVAIRYPKGSDKQRQTSDFEVNEWEKIKEGDKVTLLAVGPRMVKIASEYANGHEGVEVVSARKLKPISTSTLEQIKNTLVITLEENSVIGGFGTYLEMNLKEIKPDARVIKLGVPDKFIGHGTIDNQLKQCGLTIEGIDRAVNGQK
ncbi:MAG: 1-deoxy-D-xylulose-5-phosphate synthase [Clostridia bacterium]|nr:1-deoxy-D-xylulose-5-phosphate synthase [Clostridia bacterium]